MAYHNQLTKITILAEKCRQLSARPIEFFIRRLFKWLLLSVLVNLSFIYPGAAASRPSLVTTGIFVNQIYAVSLKDNKFTVDFYIWFRHTDKTIKPLDGFEIMNGRIESKTGMLTKEINGISYSVCRVVATVNKFWDVAQYPLDRHVLSIQIEDSDNDAEKLLFKVDTESSGINPAAQVRGWKITGVHGDVSTSTATTNYGDISLPSNSTSSFSRYAFSIDVVRQGYGHFFKLFSILFLAVFVAFLAFFVQPSAGPRFGLGTGALFAAAANSFVVSSSLPESSGLTMADLLQITTIGFIFLSLAISTLSLRKFNNGQDALSRQIDRIAVGAFPMLYGFFLAWVLNR